MKILRIPIIGFLLIFLILPNFQYDTYAPLMVPSKEQLFNESAIIVVGNVISASEVQNGTRTEYVIQPQEYLKPFSNDATKPIIAYGVGSNGFNVYARIFHVGDKALFFLKYQNDIYFIMPYSIWTKSGCNGEQLLALNYSPGDFSIKQGNNTVENMIVGDPINITGYAQNSFDLKSRDVEMDFIVHTPKPDLVLAEKKEVHIDECKGFAQSSFVFVPIMSGRYSVSVASLDANGKQFGGGSLCCITVSGKNKSSLEYANANQVPVSNQSAVGTATSWCVGCVPSDQLHTNGILIPSISAAAVIGFWVFYFKRFKD